MEKLETIKNKITEIDAQIKQKLEYHNQILNSLTQLNNERDVVRNDINTLNGALAAYKQTVEFLEGDSQPQILEAEVV